MKALFGFIGLVVAVLSCVAAWLVVPEFREMLGWSAQKDPIVNPSSWNGVEPGAPMEGSYAGQVREFGGIQFVWCPPGEFLMGSPETEEDRDDDETQHRVILTSGFWMAKTECTQGQYKALMKTNPSRFQEGNTDDFPVESVSWHDAQSYIAKLRAQLKLPAGWDVSLPTEAQWEYACRAGTGTLFSFGWRLAGTMANCDGNYPYGTESKKPYLGKTTRVGSYRPNPWGLVDLHGNVWEWCQDWYGEDYYANGQRDPKGPQSGSIHILRGGGWASIAGRCRSASRNGYSPAYGHRGFRVVLAP